MNTAILEDGTSKRKHRVHLNGLLKSTTGTVRIASAYVTERALLTLAPDREQRLLLSLMPMDLASGATSLETLGALVKAGVECRELPERPRLHAKVYIFGSSHAVITSANLTSRAFDSNIEAGVQLPADRVPLLIQWFDKLWDIGSPLDLKRLAKLQSETRALRAEYVKLEKKAKARLRSPASDAQNEKLSDTLKDLFANASRFFVCNTDRKQKDRTPTGGFSLEEAMFTRGFAAAWEDFNYPDHMDQVRAGDAIFMFAKGVGIIRVGVAMDRCHTLPPDDPDRIRNFEYERNAIEWRVPVHWLDWKDEASAYPYKSPNCTFWNITDSKYDELREDLKRHFLAGT
jgi:hypothetical protein